MFASANGRVVKVNGDSNILRWSRFVRFGPRVPGHWVSSNRETLLSPVAYFVLYDVLQEEYVETFMVRQLAIGRITNQGGEILKKAILKKL